MVEKRFKSLTESKIENIQKKLGVIFPDDYRLFLREFGGGVVEKDEKNIFAIPSINREISIDVLFGCDDENHDTINILYWMEEFEDELSKGAIVIGDTLMHGFLVLICDGEDRGVYYWDDSYNFEASDDENNMYKICDSFQELIERII